jgi:hypothetical protein
MVSFFIYNVSMRKKKNSIILSGYRIRSKTSSGFLFFVLLISFSFSPATLKAVYPSRPPGIADWPVEVRDLYNKILSMSDNPPGPISDEVRKLAHIGPAAKEALETMADNPKLPTGHRALSGFAVADFAAFDPQTLKKLCHHSNDFVKGTAAKHLAELGGRDNRNFLETIMKKYPFIARNVGRSINGMPENTRLSQNVMKLLDQVLNTPDRKIRARSQVMLAEDYPREAAWGFKKMVDLMPNKDARISCAIGLAHIYRNDIDTLKSLTSRKTDKFVRLEAARALAKLGEPGQSFLRKLIADGKDPLTPHINKLLNK